jgi:hypothetical protein
MGQGTAAMGQGTAARSRRVSVSESALKRQAVKRVGGQSTTSAAAQDQRATELRVPGGTRSGGKS